MTTSDDATPTNVIELRPPGADVMRTLEDLHIFHAASRFARVHLRPLETAPENEFVIVGCKSGYHGIDLVLVTAMKAPTFRPHNPWINEASDALSDSGYEPIGWAPMPEIILPRSIPTPGAA